MSLNNLGKTKEILDIFSNQELLDNLKLEGIEKGFKSLLDGMSVEDFAKNLQKMGLGLDDIIDLLSEAETGSEEVKKIMESLGASGVKSFKGIGTAIKGFFLSPLGKVSIVGAAIMAVVTGIQLYNANIEKSIEKANEAAGVYNSQVSSLETYEKEILSLKESLASEAISEEEQYNARQRLLEIQEDLISNYAFERGELDLLTMSANRVSAAFDGMTASMAAENLAKNASAIDKSIEEIEEVRSQSIDLIHLDRLDERGIKAIKSLIDKYDNLTLVELPDISGVNKWSLRATGNVDELRETFVSLSGEMSTLSTQLKADGIDIDDVFDFGGSWAKKIENELKAVDKVIGTYEETYNNAIVWKVATEGYVDAEGNLQSYNSLMGDLTVAQEEYKNAITSSYDTEEERISAVSAAIKKMQDVKSRFEGITFDEDDAGVKNYFQDIFDQLQDSLEQEQFRIDIQATVNGGSPSNLAKDLIKKVNAFAGKDGKVNAIDIRSAGQAFAARESSGFSYLGSELTDQEHAWLQLKAACDQYNVSVEEAIGILTTLGIVQDGIADSGDQAVTEALSNSEKIKESLSDLWNSESFTDTKSQLVEMVESLGEISPDTIKELAKESDDLAEIVSGFLKRVEIGNISCYNTYARFILCSRKKHFR